MRNFLRKKQDKQPARGSEPSPSSSASAAEQDQSSSRRPSEASSVYTQRTSYEEEEEVFFDDASTIRPTRRYADSVFSDTASTLQEDMYACLGPQDSTEGGASGGGGSSGSGTRAPMSSSAPQQALAGRAAANALGTTHAARGARDMVVPRAYWHEPRDFAPFNPFEEVARLSQRERVELALKNAKGPQYRELAINGSYGYHA